MTGRIVEEDGSPISGVHVELCEGDLTLRLDRKRTPLGRAGVSAVGVTTGGDGRFTVAGPGANTVHVLALSGTDGRAALRAVGQSLYFGVLTDIGDVVLPPFGIVSGRVIDEDGDPVAGARVRLGPMPEAVLRTGCLDLREECWVHVNWWGAEVSPHVVGLVDSLPVATTTTDPDGAFRLVGVPLAQVAGGVDKQSYVATIIPSFGMTEGERDLGKIRLEAGRVIQGHVVDALGSPVAGAHVRAGALPPGGDMAFFQPASALTDDKGRFEVTGISELGDAVAVARREYGESWNATELADGSTEHLVVLPAAAPLKISVRDVGGDPVEGACVTVHRVPGEAESFAAEALAILTVRAPRDLFDTTEIEPGEYVVSELSLGEWIVRVVADGLVRTEAAVEHTLAAAPCEIVCPAGRSITVVVIDTVTRESVPSAHVQVLTRIRGEYVTIDEEFTDAAGVALLGPVAWAEEAADEAPDEAQGRETEELRYDILVEHPGHAANALEVPATSETITIELAEGLELNGRITCAGSTPSGAYTIGLRPVFLDGDSVLDEFASLLTAWNDPEGAFRFTGLSPGLYEIVVHHRPEAEGQLAHLFDDSRPRLVHTEHVELASGVGEPLAIDLGEDGEGPMARFAGRVRVNGEPVVGASVSITGPTELLLSTDTFGEFTSDFVTALGSYRVSIRGDVPGPDGSVFEWSLLDDHVTPEPGAVRRLDVDLVCEFTMVTIEVVNAVTGKPVPEAQVSIQAGDGMHLTGADGRARVPVDGRGDHWLDIDVEGYVFFRGKIEVSADGDAQTFRLELTPTVPCAGRVVLPARFAGQALEVYMRLDPTASEREFWFEVRSRTLQFESDALTEGGYAAHLWVNETRIGTVDIWLGPDGNSRLVLDFSTE